MSLDDIDKDRVGPWMQTSRGERFFPLDPRQEEIYIEDIANGLAQCGRYNGQRLIDKFYSVAEHSVKMVQYADERRWPAAALLACLLHDAPEGYLNDLNRAMKHAMRIQASDNRNSHYDIINAKVENAINVRFNIVEVVNAWHYDIKLLDQRIVPLEKAAVMAPAKYEWAFDVFEPLPGVEIECWDAPKAKKEFLSCYWSLELRRKQEEGYDE